MLLMATSYNTVTGTEELIRYDEAEYSGESVPLIPGESEPPIPWQSVPTIPWQSVPPIPWQSVPLFQARFVVRIYIIFSNFFLLNDSPFSSSR